MQHTIHPSAVIEDGAVIGAGCAIGPFCHVGPALLHFFVALVLIEAALALAEILAHLGHILLAMMAFAVAVMVGQGKRACGHKYGSEQAGVDDGVVTFFHGAFLFISPLVRQWL